MSIINGLLNVKLNVIVNKFAHVVVCCLQKVYCCWWPEGGQWHLEAFSKHLEMSSSIKVQKQMIWIPPTKQAALLTGQCEKQNQITGHITHAEIIMWGVSKEKKIVFCQVWVIAIPIISINKSFYATCLWF